MSGEAFTVNSDSRFEGCVEWLRGLYKAHGYITVAKPRIGPDRSLDQNSLLHVWLTEYAAHLLHKNKRDVTPGELDGMKRHAKGQFHAANPQCKAWMVHEVINPKTGQIKKDFTSSARWKRGELTFFLDWLAQTAAGDGLILEAKGEYAKAKREQVA